MRASEGNNSRLVAPRRFGKTSLLRRALHDAQREGWAAVYVDFFGVLTLDDIAQRIERAYAEQLSGRLGSWFSGVRRMLRPTVRAGGGPVPGAVEVTVDAQAEPPLLERLALILARRGRRWTRRKRPREGRRRAGPQGTRRSGQDAPSIPVDMIEAVPRISAFYGIVIEMYFGDHPPPHFHARYSGDAAKIEIATGAVIVGSLPRRALRLVREWVEEHRDELEANWERAVRYEETKPIEPLR